MHLSDLSKSAKFASLECLPRVGEALAEQYALPIGEDGEEDDGPLFIPLDGVVLSPEGRRGMQPKYGAMGTICKGMLGGQIPGTANMGVELK